MLSYKINNKINKFIYVYKESEMKKLPKDFWLYKYKIAHRGSHNLNSPENSMKAFENAIKNNYAIELDVHILKDNNIVVFHDKNLERMTSID